MSFLSRENFWASSKHDEFGTGKVSGFLFAARGGLPSFPKWLRSLALLDREWKSCRDEVMLCRFLSTSHNRDANNVSYAVAGVRSEMRILFVQHVKPNRQRDLPLAFREGDLTLFSGTVVTDGTRVSRAARRCPPFFPRWCHLPEPRFDILPPPLRLYSSCIACNIDFTVAVNSTASIADIRNTSQFDSRGNY